MLTLEQKVKTIHYLRKNRILHPNGRFDRGGRWYPKDEEDQECCSHIRSPSRDFPYSLMTHCRSRAHIMNVFTKHPNLYDSILKYYDKEQIPLMINDNLLPFDKKTIMDVLNGKYKWLL